MEFVMLDPYYRVSLKPTPTKYELEFTLPDKYGVFQFKVDYRRPGYSFIHVAEKVTIRPYRHDEYERYLQ
jgi:oligosaccharyltransferase complex subunit beta